MSIDLSNFDMYNYEFMLRPDGQTATHSAGVATNVATISNNVLKSQFMNIPSQYNMNPKNKVYFYLRDIQINNRDSLAIYSGHLHEKYYLQVKTSGLYNYSNFVAAATKIADGVQQNVQPGYALVPINFQPIIVDYFKLPLKGTEDASADGLEGDPHLNEDLPAVLRAQHNFQHPLLSTIYPGGGNAPTDNTSDNLGDDLSSVSIPVGVKEHPEGNQEETWLITQVGTRKFVKALTLDKSTNVLDRMVCINSPFGNAIEFQLTNVSPTVSATKDADEHVTGHTHYNCNISTQKMGGAVVISFSLLVEKSTTKY